MPTTKTIHHNLVDVLFLATTYVIFGCQGCGQMEDFGNDKLTWSRQYLPFTEGIPSDDTISRIFKLIYPKEFYTCFVAWMKICCEMTHGSVIAIDDKTLK